MASTTIGCKGCGSAITAKRSGQVTIWLEANGRKHVCKNTGNFASAEVHDAEVEAGLSLEAVYAELAKLDADKVKEAEEAPMIVHLSPEHVDGQVPSKDGDYLIRPEDLAAIKRVIALADKGKAQNIGLHGPKGSGKSTLGVQVGALRGSQTWVIDSTDKQTADEWFGTQTLVDGNVVYEVSDFVKAIETPNAVVVLDDVALLQSVKVQNGLNAILDPSRRSIYVQQMGRVVKVAEGVVFVGTWNVGSEYTGASELSAQILDRFRAGALFEVPVLDNGALEHVLRARSGISAKHAKQLASLPDWLKADKVDVEASARGLIGAANHIVGGATYGEAVFYTVFGELDEETRQKAYGSILKNALPADRVAWAVPVKSGYVRLA